jgi:hypothetical protein
LSSTPPDTILSQIDEWFTSGLAGIRQARGSVGYRQLVIDPRQGHTTSRPDCTRELARVA